MQGISLQASFHNRENAVIFFDKLRLIASASIVELFINVQVADMSTVVKFPQHHKH